MGVKTPTPWSDPAPAPRDQALWFAQLMERELRANDHKNGWETLSIPWLLHRIHQELKELEDAIHYGKPADVIASEAADVGNFLMMLADNYRDMERRKQQGEDAHG